MSSLRCRWFGHRWTEKYEMTGDFRLLVLWLPFGFDFRPFPMIAPRLGRLLGVKCERCGLSEDRNNGGGNG